MGEKNKYFIFISQKMKMLNVPGWWTMTRNEYMY